MSPWCDIESCLKQGYAMSVFLFNFYLDSCLQGRKQSDMRVKVGDLSVSCCTQMMHCSLHHQNAYTLVNIPKEGCENKILEQVNEVRYY